VVHHAAAAGGEDFLIVAGLLKGKWSWVLAGLALLLAWYLWNTGPGNAQILPLGGGVNPNAVNNQGP
jgi:hypothetical protein